MLIVPDPTTVIMDPFCEIPTLSLVCNVFDPLTKQKYDRDPRNIAQKAEAYLKQTGIADTAYFDPKQSFLFLTTFAMIRTSSRATTTSIQLKESGIPAVQKIRNLDIKFGTRKDTSRCLLQTLL